jgi:hypothetical protein
LKITDVPKANKDVPLKGRQKNLFGA